jgi:hypothetical protein
LAQYDRDVNAARRQSALGIAGCLAAPAPPWVKLACVDVILGVLDDQQGTAQANLFANEKACYLGNLDEVFRDNVFVGDPKMRGEIEEAIGRTLPIPPGVIPTVEGSHTGEPATPTPTPLTR